MSSRATDEAQRAFELGLSLDDAGNAQRAAAVLARMRAHFATYRCSHCWLKSSYCICAHLPPKVATSVDVRVIAHGKEFGNCNNTAKLLPLMLEGASMLFHPAETAGLFEGLDSAHLLLWPGPSSVPAASVREWLAAQPGRVTLNVLDGTWNQAKGLARRVPPSVVRVNVDDLVSEPSLFRTLRYHPTLERVCTAEAVALALRGLGQPADELAPLFAALRMQVDAASGLLGRRAVFGGDELVRTLRAADAEREAAAVGSTVTARPERCDHCGATRDETTFKNLRLIYRPRACLTAGDDGLVRVRLRVRLLRVWRCRACNGVFERVHMTD